MKAEATVPTANLEEEPYASILCYPKPAKEEVQNRIAELEKLGVESVEFAGRTSAFNLPILGKGYVGLVVIAQRYSQRVAMKIRRMDADRPSLFHEAAMLAKANEAGVGPRLVEATSDFILMQLVDGELLPVWLEAQEDKGILKQVLGEVMEQCWHLDLIGLDHGELSKAPKHVMVDRWLEPWILDFESSSESRRPANVTAISHYLFMSKGAVARRVGDIVGRRNRASIIEALRKYKKDGSREKLDLVLAACLC